MLLWPPCFSGVICAACGHSHGLTATADYPDAGPNGISSPLGPAWLSLLGKTASGTMNGSAQAADGFDRNQPRVKMEGFEWVSVLAGRRYHLLMPLDRSPCSLSPPPVSHKTSAPTPQDILARFNSQSSIRSPSVPQPSNAHHQGHPAKPAEGLSFPHSFGQDTQAHNGQHFGQATNFGSFQPFRSAYGSQAASTFDADLFALTSGVDGVGMGYDDMQTHGNGMSAYQGMNLNAQDMAGNGQPFAFGQHASAPAAGYYGPGFNRAPNGADGRSVSGMIHFPGSPISTQGFSSLSTGSMMTGSSMPHSFPIQHNFGGHGRSEGLPTSSGGHSGDGRIEEDHSLSGGDLTESPRMDGPRPRKMSKSGTGQDDVTTRSPTWPVQGMPSHAPPAPAQIRRASVAERPGSSVHARWSAQARSSAGVPDALRRSSTGQSGSVRPAFNTSQSEAPGMLHESSSASRQTSTGLDRFLMPSRQAPSSGGSASRSPNTQHSTSTSDKSPLRTIEQVDEEGSMDVDQRGNALGTSALDDDPSPMSGEFVDFSGNQPGGKSWPRPSTADDGVDDADDDSASV